jgi:hypothetical protein
MNKQLKILSLTALLICSGATAGTVDFSALPNGIGHIDSAPGSTSGWGYTIQNSTTNYLLPLGLSQSGVVYGTLVDIFDYPVVDPGQTILQPYTFNTPGGWGNSLGLFEYSMPADVPIGLIQSGLFVFSYQLYDANPDLDPNAIPIGDPTSIVSSFEVTSTNDTSTNELPEPATFIPVVVALGVLYRYDARRTRR